MLCGLSIPQTLTPPSGSSHSQCWMLSFPSLQSRPKLRSLQQLKYSVTSSCFLLLVPLGINENDLTSNARYVNSMNRKPTERGYLEHSLLPWNCVERGRVSVVMDLIMGFVSFSGAAVMHQALLYISSGLCSADPCCVLWL